MKHFLFKDHMQSVSSPEFKDFIKYFYDKSVINDEIRYSFFDLLKHGTLVRRYFLLINTRFILFYTRFQLEPAEDGSRCVPAQYS